MHDGAYFGRRFIELDMATKSYACSKTKTHRATRGRERTFRQLVAKSLNCLKLPMNLPCLTVYLPPRTDEADFPNATNHCGLSWPSLVVPRTSRRSVASCEDFRHSYFRPSDVRVAARAIANHYSCGTCAESAFPFADIEHWRK